MLIIIGIYAAVVWLLFFRLKLLPWNTFSKVLVSIVGLGILFTFMGLLNTRTPSGRITVMAPTVEVAPLVSGIICEVPVKTHQRINKGDLLFSLDKRPFEYAVQQAQAQQKTGQNHLPALKKLRSIEVLRPRVPRPSTTQERNLKRRPPHWRPRNTTSIGQMPSPSMTASLVQCACRWATKWRHIHPSCR